ALDVLRVAPVEAPFERGERGLTPLLDLLFPKVPERLRRRDLVLRLLVRLRVGVVRALAEIGALVARELEAEIDRRAAADLLDRAERAEQLLTLVGQELHLELIGRGLELRGGVRGLELGLLDLHPLVRRDVLRDADERRRGRVLRLNITKL